MTGQTSPSAVPGAASARQPSPLVSALFRELRNGPEQDRLYVWRVLQGPGSRQQTPRQTLSLLAMEAFREEHGHYPSKMEYERWTVGEQGKVWPSSRYIANSFDGKWRNARSALGEEPVLDLAGRRLLARGGPITREEAIAALKEFAGETRRGEAGFAAYRAWACAYTRRQTRALARVPLARNVFRKLFGSWAQALRAAGLELPSRRDGIRATQGANCDYTKEAIATWLREWATGQAPEALRAHDWDTWAQAREREMQLAGQERCIPRQKAITRRFGSFAHALHEAGVISDEELRKRLRHTRTESLTDEQALDVLRRARGSRERITRGEYKSWREHQLAARPESDPRTIPSESLIRQRFGGFKQACTRAREFGSGFERPSGRLETDFERAELDSGYELPQATSPREKRRVGLGPVQGGGPDTVPRTPAGPAS